MRFYSYRLSPEYPSPVPLQDCERATRYFFVHAHSFGVDRSKIGVIGGCILSLALGVGDDLATYGGINCLFAKQHAPASLSLIFRKAFTRTLK